MGEESPILLAGSPGLRPSDFDVEGMTATVAVSGCGVDLNST